MTYCRVLVLGANGFIGTAFARASFNAGHAVLGIGRSPNIRKENFYRPSVFDSKSLLALVTEFRPTLCVNAAGASRPAASFEKPETDFTANTMLVIAILEALRKAAPECKYIGFSSAAVYGNNPDLPWKETVRGFPNSPYGYHKLGAELLAEEYARLYGLKILTLRAFSVYGPGLRKQLFWDIFCRSRLASELQLYGTGGETRDFIYIDDVVSGVERLVASATFSGEVYNLASGQATTIVEACQILLQHLGWNGCHYFTGDQIPGAPSRMEADVTRMVEQGFRCRVNLWEGLRRTAAWLQTTNADVEA